MNLHEDQHGKGLAYYYIDISQLIQVLLILYVCVAAYKDLQDRVETRKAAWDMPGWDECVVKTG